MEDIEFAALAKDDPDFAKVLKENNKIDFWDPLAVQQLTKSVLRRDFKLEINLPGDRLCPPVPNRFAYIKWLQKLIDSTGDSYRDAYEESREVIGIDIGVGASCIYPLLGCASRPNWRFGGTEIDARNLEFAQKNVRTNGLESRIRILPAKEGQPLISLAQLGTDHADFVMCNPPFFTSLEDMDATYETKTKPPSAVCTGAAVEMITDGGDLGFALQIFALSQSLKTKIQWYSCLLGKLQSAKDLVARLKESEITNFAAHCLQTGGRTKRWLVAWSYDDLRPEDSIARGDGLSKELLPPSTSAQILVRDMPASNLGDAVNQIFADLPLRWIWKASNLKGLALATENVWSRSYRRKMKFQGDSTSKSDEDRPVALAVLVLVHSNQVTVRWMRGEDHVLYESFCGMLRRSLLAK
ncbi:DUF890 domain protein [Eremomyces bilateralis CBS 781.70]|uniref:DUF890 domain protein n=1 Tax=Eremomyces bilateralis CBS 781.70 TaxID=1392243 RepID=A0A6G1G0M8_9PEZI|nr:DUF890 domain protein [Eremomyces bilateralis CBS 781.70]KAF1811593.1 DUF890 domain protein [Eremomyces bilateralis CBS 781.70]